MIKTILWVEDDPAELLLLKHYGVNWLPNEPQLFLLIGNDRNQLSRLGPIPVRAGVLHKRLRFDAPQQAVADWPCA